MKSTVSQERIAELKEMDEPGSDEVLRQLVKLYLTGAPDKLKQIRVSLSDPSELKKTAHALKSTSLNMGCEILADLCLQIEQGVGNASALIDQCENEFKKVMAEFKRLNLA